MKEYGRIKYKGLSFCTNGNIDPSGKANVYFCCHPIDFDMYFESIKNEIWMMFPEIAFWYSDQADETEFPELLLEDIRQMNLIIVPITKRFIEDNNISRTLILPYAVEHHIAILPLLLEDGIEDEFNNSCGNLQYVKKLSDTHKYADSLRKYLDSVLLDKEIQAKIESEFSLRLFISYRKKDKGYVNQIQRIIHSETRLRDAAIWYDDYLIPGERFDSNLSKMIQQCDAFIILITPNLLEEDNYVMNYEYPLAIRMHKRIIPIQVVETDRDRLLYYYENIPNPISLFEVNNFTEIIQNTGIELMTVDDSPRHLYLIGNAYLNGFEVEPDFDKAISLISEAANNGYIEAYKRLISIYRDGYFTIKAPNKVVYWEEQYIRCLLSKNAGKPLEVFYHLRNSGDAYYEMQEYNTALEKYELAFQIVNFLTKKLGNTINYDTIEEWQCLSDIYLKEGQTYEQLERLDKAEMCFRKSLKIDSELDENKETESYETLRNLAISLATIGDFYLRHNRLIKAKHAFKHAVQLLDPSTHSVIWGPPNQLDVVYHGFTELKAAKVEYHHLMYSYESLAEIAVKRLQINLALSNYEKAQIPAYKLYKMDKSRDTMLQLIRISLWIVCLKDYTKTLNKSDIELVKSVLNAINESISIKLAYCLLLPVIDVEKFLFDILKTLGFEEPIEKGITREDILESFKKYCDISTEDDNQ